MSFRLGWIFSLLFVALCACPAMRALAQDDVPAERREQEKRERVDSDSARQSPQAAARKAASARPESSPRNAAERKAAARKAAGDKESESAPGKQRDGVITPEREAAALEFAARHHPELAELIGSLKQGNPREYQRAIRELFRTSERMASIHERDPERYAMEIEAWKINSRLRLLAARLTMTSDPELEAELRELLARQLDVRLALLTYERNRTEERLQQLNQTIETVQRSRERQLERSYQQLLRSIGESRPASRKLPDVTVPRRLKANESREEN